MSAIAGVMGVAHKGAAAEAGVFPAVDGNWHHYQSPSFELYSRTDDTSSREFLHNMEVLRALFIDWFKSFERTKLDITIFSFREAEDFRAYADASIRANPDVRGFYQAWPDRAIISLSPMDDEDGARRLIFHEYVHHLFTATESDPPIWFNEGLAELLAGFKVVDGKLEVGHPHIGRILALQDEKLLPLETLFAVKADSPLYRGKDHAGIFYAESWALLHYWYFGQSKIPREAVDRFLRVAADQKTADSVNLRSYFRQCFAMDYPDMVKALERYVTSGSYRWGKQPLPKAEPAATYVARAVSIDEMRTRLAELAVRTEHSPQGKLALLEAAGKTPPDSRALEVLGAAARVEGEEAQAQERWEAALAAGAHNPTILRELSLMESRQWFETFNPDFHLPAERADRLRARLLQSITYEPKQSAAYEMLAWVEAYSDKRVAANINLVQQNFKMLKHRDRTLIALVFLRWRGGLADDAKELLAGLDKLESDVWSRQAAEDMRARWENRLPQLVSKTKDDKGSVLELVAGSSGLKIPSVKLPPKPAP